MNTTAIIGKIKNALDYGSRLRPQRDWFVLLGVCALLFAASFAWNAWLFTEVAAGQSLGGGAHAAAAPAVNAAPLENVDTLFAARADEAARYKSSYSFVDPSK